MVDPVRPQERLEGESAQAPVRPTGKWGLAFSLILVVHVVWTYFDAMPPVWDMAHHQIQGWHFAEALRQGTILARFQQISDYYPPLYYLLEALGFLLIGSSKWLPLAANLAGLILLSYCTFRLAWRVTASPRAWVAGILVLLFPLVAWTSRETLIDPFLSGAVALALFVLVSSRHLESRLWSWLFGLVVAFGALVKWTFVLFLVPAVLYSLVRSGNRRRSGLNLLDASLIAAPLSFLWYLPNLSSLIRRFELTSLGAVWEQDPGLGSLWGWIYYPRSLSSYYLFLPLTLFLLLAWIGLRRTSLRDRETFQMLSFVLIVSLFLLTVLQAKDPRYVMPVVSILAVWLVVGCASRPAWTYALLGIAFCQFFYASFSLPLLPAKVALFTVPEDRDFVGMRQEWVWMASHYFGILGPPRQEDWRYEELLEILPAGAAVGFVPDAAFFNPVTLERYALLGRKPLEIVSLGGGQEWLSGLEQVDWVIGKTGSQGVSYITLFNAEVYDAVETLNWPVVEESPLPDGSRMIIWRSPSLSP